MPIKKNVLKRPRKRKATKVSKSVCCTELKYEKYFNNYKFLNYLLMPEVKVIRCSTELHVENLINYINYSSKPLSENTVLLILNDFGKVFNTFYFKNEFFFLQSSQTFPWMPICLRTPVKTMLLSLRFQRRRSRNTGKSMPGCTKTKVAENKYDVILFIFILIMHQI